MTTTLIKMSGVSNDSKLSKNFVSLSAPKPEQLSATFAESVIPSTFSKLNGNESINPRQQFQPPSGKSQTSLEKTTQQNLNLPPTAPLTTSRHPSSLPNQLWTVATIHQNHSQQHKPIQQALPTNSAAQSTDITSIETTTLSPSILQQQLQIPRQTAPQIEAAPTRGPHSRRTLGNPQTLKSSNDLRAPAHCIPPRYLPPPKPANSGILKHVNTLPSRESERATKSNLTHFLDSTEINIKYPPDIPQLSPAYIPDSIKTQSSSLRCLQQQSHVQKYRNAFLLSGSGSNNHHHNYQQQQYRQNQIEQQQHQQDMLKFVRKTEQDHPSPNASVSSSATNIPSTGSRLTAEQNRQLQSLINELRILKDQNQRLLDDNQELRDLCCFLDDDRQKGRKLAREWQRFGRYTASVMRQEVSTYQNKLRQLDDKQQELITDNLELKELCLYLDEERAHVATNTLCANCGASIRNPLRDDGDGSSSSTNVEETISTLRNYENQMPDMHLRATLNDQTLQYVRSLERRIQQLEEERVIGTISTSNMIAQQPPARQQKLQQSAQDTLPDPISSRPEAVVRALQVLEVREQLERDRLNTIPDSTADQMDDGEKALVREMCNVVWRKLENNVSNVPNTMDQL